MNYKTHTECNHWDGFQLVITYLFTTDFQNCWNDIFYDSCEEEARVSVGMPVRKGPHPRMS